MSERSNDLLSAVTGASRVLEILEVDEDARERATHALEAEVQRRNEWYGLDNWTMREVVNFVCDEVEHMTLCTDGTSS